MPPFTRLVLATLMLLLGVASSASAAAFDYTKVSNVSQPKFTTEKTVVRLPAFDGRQLYIEVTKPKAPGRYPVILEASPYHGTLADRDGTRILPEPRDVKGKSVGLTGYFAPRGYAVVMMDLRGTGRSQGCLDHLGAKDGRDLEQVVEWAASRGWSNGRVGMTGHSYVGSTPSVAAAQQPKGLKTIVPSAGLASMYHHQFQGGVPYFLQYVGPMVAYEQLAIERKLPGGDDAGTSLEETGCGMPQSAVVTGEDQLSGRYSKWHAERDSGDGARRADIPVFAVHGINDNAARVAALDWFLARRDKRDKLWLGQWDHGSGCCPTRRGLQWTGALHAWFDKHLARRRVSTGPALEAFMADTSSFSAARKGERTEILTDSRLPLNDTSLTFYPSADGTLGAQPAAEQKSSSFSGNGQGAREVLAADPTWKTGVSFATAPLDRDVVMAGLPELQLTASVSAPRVHLIANVLDEDPAGKRRRISQFALNPELRDGIDKRSTVVPGQKYVLDPEGFAMAHHLRAGHRLVLQVTTSDADKVPTFAVDPRVTVFSGGADGTRLTVPVVSRPKLHADTVPLAPVEAVPDAPAQAPVRGTVTTKAPGVGARVGGVTSEYFEFDVIEGHDNATMQGTAKPSRAADLDLYLQRKDAGGGWVAAGDGDNDGSLEGERITTGRLQPGRYRLDVHNFAGTPGDQVAIDLTFFDSDGTPGG